MVNWNKRTKVTVGVMSGAAITAAIITVIVVATQHNSDSNGQGTPHNSDSNGQGTPGDDRGDSNGQGTPGDDRGPVKRPNGTATDPTFKIQSVDEWPLIFPSYPPLDTSYYKKFISVDGFPVASSEKSEDAALSETAKWTKIMLDFARPDVRERMIANRGKLTLMARYPLEKTTDVPEHDGTLIPPDIDWDERARGVGGIPGKPTASCAVENVMCEAEDRFRSECIMIHEFAHTMIDLGGEPAFLARVGNIYRRAVEKGLWKGEYAQTNQAEYWGEGVQNYFDCNRYRQGSSAFFVKRETRAALFDYDPELAEAISDFFQGNTRSYTCPDGKGYRFCEDKASNCAARRAAGECAPEQAQFTDMYFACAGTCNLCTGLNE